MDNFDSRVMIYARLSEKPKIFTTDMTTPSGDHVSVASCATTMYVPNSAGETIPNTTLKKSIPLLLCCYGINAEKLAAKSKGDYVFVCCVLRESYGPVKGGKGETETIYEVQEILKSSEDCVREYNELIINFAQNHKEE